MRGSYHWGHFVLKTLDEATNYERPGPMRIITVSFSLL